MTDSFAQLKSSVLEAVTPVYTRWGRYVEREDVTQQMWLWIAANKNEAETAAPAALVRKLRNAGERYCRKEKASRAGYDTADECYYSINQLERIVWDAFDAEATPPGEPYREDEKYSEWVTEVAEVRAAVRKETFAKKHYTALDAYVNSGRERDTGIMEALWALQRQVGGSRPK